MNDHADRHAALRESLVALGATDDEIDTAVREERLPELVTDLVLWPERERVTLSEAALRSGVSQDVVRTAVMRLGLPVPDEDEARLVARAVEALVVLRGGAELFGEDAMLQFTRVVGSACGAIAEAAVSVFGVGLASGRIDPGSDQFDYAETVLETTMA